MRKVLYEGKSKRIYEGDNDFQVIVEYKDEVTAFNSLKKAKIKNKGVLCNKISTIIYNYLEKEGIKTHLIKLIDDHQQLCERVNVVPLEVIIRNVAAGSIVENLGFHEGDVFEEPIVEFCYKDDALKDPIVNESHIKALKLTDEDTLSEIKNTSLLINQLLISLFDKTNLLLVDFKVEFGINTKGELVLADEISPDNMRLWDKDTLSKLDKDTYRQDIGPLYDAYHEVLTRLESI